MSRKERVNFADVKVGADHFENSYSPISYDDGDGKFKPLFILEQNIDTQEVFLSTKIRDKDGRFLAKLYRNNFVPQGDPALNGEREFQTKRIPNTFKLIRKKDCAVLFYAKAEIVNSWKVNGVFHVKLGDAVTKIEITDLATVISNDNYDITTCNNKINAGGIKISEHEFCI